MSHKNKDKKRKQFDNWADPLKKMPSSSGYGEDRGSHRHAGEDYSAPKGTKVFSAGKGKVVNVGNDSAGYGRYIDIKHKGGIVTRYAHLSKAKVNDGDKIKAGSKIGKVGNTGRSYGAHLHFEVRKGGGFGYGGTKDPAKFLRKKTK